MTAAQKRVLDMVAQGKITSREGDDLLKAMAGRKRPGIGLLINPFDGISPPVGIIIGAVTAALSVAIALGMGCAGTGSWICTRAAK